MDENEKLLKTIINIHYRDRPHVVSKALQIIQDYCNDEQSYNKYCEVLQKLRDLMADLPQTILLYFLTTVPDPNLDLTASPPPLIGLMKEMQLRLTESIKCVLNDYISKSIPPSITIEQDSSEKLEENVTAEFVKEETGSSNDFGRVAVTLDTESCSTPCRVPERCKKLIDICAEYVVSNLDSLNSFYETKNEAAWSKLNSNFSTTKDQNTCYDALKDINKKRNWLRLIDCGYISGKELRDHYGESEILMLEHVSHAASCQSSAEDKKKLMEAIHAFVTNEVVFQ